MHARQLLALEVAHHAVLLQCMRLPDISQHALCIDGDNVCLMLLCLLPCSALALSRQQQLWPSTMHAACPQVALRAWQHRSVPLAAVL